MIDNELATLAAAQMDRFPSIELRGHLRIAAAKYEIQAHGHVSERPEKQRPRHMCIRVNLCIY
jgi:hypothetical protein